MTLDENLKVLKSAFQYAYPSARGRFIYQELAIVVFEAILKKEHRADAHCMQQSCCEELKGPPGNTWCTPGARTQIDKVHWVAQLQLQAAVLGGI